MEANTCRSSANNTSNLNQSQISQVVAGKYPVEQNNSHQEATGYAEQHGQQAHTRHLIRENDREITVNQITQNRKNCFGNRNNEPVGPGFEDSPFLREQHGTSNMWHNSIIFFHRHHYFQE